MDAEMKFSNIQQIPQPGHLIKLTNWLMMEENLLEIQEDSEKSDEQQPFLGFVGFFGFLGFLLLACNNSKHQPIPEFIRSRLLTRHHKTYINTSFLLSPPFLCVLFAFISTSERSLQSALPC